MTRSATRPSGAAQNVQTADEHGERAKHAAAVRASRKVRLDPLALATLQLPIEVPREPTLNRAVSHQRPITPAASATATTSRIGGAAKSATPKIHHAATVTG